MNKQEYADKYCLDEWRELCKIQSFVDAFWLDEFIVCDTVADEVLSGLQWS